MTLITESEKTGDQRAVAAIYAEFGYFMVHFDEDFPIGHVFPHDFPWNPKIPLNSVIAGKPWRVVARTTLIETRPWRKFLVERLPYLRKTGGSGGCGAYYRIEACD